MVERFLCSDGHRLSAKGLRIGTALREGGDEQQIELSSHVWYRIPFVTLVVQLKICEIWCRVARQTVADASWAEPVAASSVGGSVRKILRP